MSLFKEFNYDHMYRGAPVQTLSGLKVSVLSKSMMTSSGKRLVGTVFLKSGYQEVCTWTEKGTFVSASGLNDVSECDLVMTPMAMAGDKGLFVGDEVVTERGTTFIMHPLWRYEGFTPPKLRKAEPLTLMGRSFDSNSKVWYAGTGEVPNWRLICVGMTHYTHIQGLLTHFDRIKRDLLAIESGDIASYSWDEPEVVQVNVDGKQVRLGDKVYRTGINGIRVLRTVDSKIYKEIQDSQRIKFEW